MEQVEPKKKYNISEEEKERRRQQLVTVRAKAIEVAKLKNEAGVLKKDLKEAEKIEKEKERENLKKMKNIHQFKKN